MATPTHILFIICFQILRTVSPHFCHHLGGSVWALGGSISTDIRMSKGKQKGIHPMKLILAGTVALVLLAGPALANECPTLIQKAQDQLKAMPTMDAALTQKVNDHIAQAQAEHDAGKHDEAVKTANDALQLLKM